MTKSDRAPSTVTHHSRRITSVSAWDASPPAATPIRWSEAAPPVVPRQTIVAVEVSDDDGGTTGLASLTYYVPPNDGGRDGRLDAAVERWLGAAVAGPPIDPRAANPYDPGGTPLGAVVELAVLDALGRATGLPAAAFLGGLRRERIEAYASLPSFAEPSGAVACASAALEAGFKAVKFHAAGSLETDLATIAAARRELGQSVALMWDASCAYELYTATAVGGALADAGFLWFEAPLADDSTEALRSLANRTSVPLVPDGLVQRPAAEWARDVRDGVWSALRLDVTRAPDLTAALRLLHLSETLGLPCEIQSFGFPLGQYANLQLMLTTDACRYFEAPFPADGFVDGIAEPPPIVDGFAHAPAAPGLGHGIELAELGRLQSLVEVSL